jgi:hypothetical protein
MKKWNAIGILTVLVIGMVLMSGCTRTGSAGTVPVATPTQQIVTATELVPPFPTLTMETPVARYSVGDIVWNNDSNYDAELHRSRGMIVLHVSEQSYTYQYVSKDDGDTLWSRIYPNEEIDTIVSFEEYYSRKVDHAASIESQYPSRTAFEDTISSESCCSSSSGAPGTTSPLNSSGYQADCS